MTDMRIKATLIALALLLAASAMAQTHTAPLSGVMNCCDCPPCQSYFEFDHISQEPPPSKLDQAVKICEAHKAEAPLYFYEPFAARCIKIKVESNRLKIEADLKALTDLGW
jgi:hypothetical protein